MLDLKQIMNELANETYNNGIFSSEADFQFQLGWKIKEKYPDYFIRFEVPFDKKRIDIIVETPNGEKIPIELKYFTKTIDGYEFLRNQQDTWRVYNFLKDVERNENYLIRNNKKKGFAILLTNRDIYWKGPTSDTIKYYPFRLTDNRPINAGVFEWDDNDGAVKHGRNGNVKLINDYLLKWEEYKTVNNVLFKYLLVGTIRK